MSRSVCKCSWLTSGSCGASAGPPAAPFGGGGATAAAPATGPPAAAVAAADPAAGRGTEAALALAENASNDKIGRLPPAVARAEDKEDDDEAGVGAAVALPAPRLVEGPAGKPKILELAVEVAPLREELLGLASSAGFSFSSLSAISFSPLRM